MGERDLKLAVCEDYEFTALHVIGLSYGFDHTNARVSI
jgi:hypothetical protein